MLKALSHNAHDVFTGIHIVSDEQEVKFTSHTKIHFSKLSDEEIERYIEECLPFDKAGAYGIQDWIGREKIEKIEGDYFNVMGFPVSRVFVELNGMSGKHIN